MSHKMAESEETLNEVNVIPLADLSLVLLIILMVLSPMAAQGIIQIMSGQAVAANTMDELPLQPETPIIISWEPNNLRLNGELYASELDFVKKLSALMQKRRDKSAILTVAPQLPHGKVVRLMDIVRRQGAENLTMLKWDKAQAAEADIETKFREMEKRS